jgi:hypothetical protein
VPRLAQGDLINRTVRTPLAVSYDPAADQLVTAVIAAGGGWQVRVIASPAGDPADRGGLTAHERAFTQALYYHRRIYRHGMPYYVYDSAGNRHENPNPDRTHALEVSWMPGRVAGGRVVAVRAWSIGEASLHAAELYGGRTG